MTDYEEKQHYDFLDIPCMCTASEARAVLTVMFNDPNYRTWLGLDRKLDYTMVNGGVTPQVIVNMSNEEFDMKAKLRATITRSLEALGVI